MGRLFYNGARNGTADGHVEISSPLGSGWKTETPPSLLITSSERDRSSLTHLLPFFGDFLLSEITPRLVNEYKSARKAENGSPCSINREISLMRHAFNLAIKEWGWVEKNPAQKVSMEREPPPRDRWLTYEEEERLLPVCPPWLQEVITFSIETGCRRGETLSLQWRDVDLFKKVVAIFGSKTQQKRTIPLTQSALEILQEKGRDRSKVRSLGKDLVFTHPLGRKININTLRAAFEDALERAQIEAFGSGLVWSDPLPSFQVARSTAYLCFPTRPGRG